MLLVWGYTLIRRKRIETHRKVMTTAFVTSCLFLVCYLVYHAQVGSKHFPSTRRDPHGLPEDSRHAHRARGRRAGAGDHHAAPRLAGRYDRHRRIARWTLPIWLYVSVTGVVVYVMLYHL